jgi:hypothetical protein
MSLDSDLKILRPSYAVRNEFDLSMIHCPMKSGANVTIYKPLKEPLNEHLKH